MHATNESSNFYHVYKWSPNDLPNKLSKPTSSLPKVLTTVYQSHLVSDPCRSGIHRLESGRHSLSLRNFLTLVRSPEISRVKTWGESPVFWGGGEVDLLGTREINTDG